MPGKYYFISFAQGPIVSPILQMRKLTDVKFPAQGHTGSTWDQNPC